MMKYEYDYFKYGPAEDAVLYRRRNNDPIFRWEWLTPGSKKWMAISTFTHGHVEDVVLKYPLTKEEAFIEML